MSRTPLGGDLLALCEAAAFAAYLRGAKAAACADYLDLARIAQLSELPEAYADFLEKAWQCR